MRKIGVLTSGGDSPGMNAAVMSVARSAAMYGIPLIGIKRGYNGLLRKSANLKDDMQQLTLELVLDIADDPGTYLRTARCLEFKEKKYQEKAVRTLKSMQIDGLVVIGGRLAVGGDYLMLPIKSTVRRLAQNFVAKDTTIVFTKLGPKAAPVGDCLIARSKMLDIL